MANYDTSTPGAPGALPEPPGAPWVTIITSMLIFFVFGGMVVFFVEYSKTLDGGPTSASGEQQLQELRAQQRDVLDNYGYDPATKTWRVPVDRAMSVLIEEGKTKGEMASFPTPKKQ